jgi:hypothetical protein
MRRGHRGAGGPHRAVRDRAAVAAAEEVHVRVRAQHVALDLLGDLRVLRNKP